jgi:hypothetical protein
MLLLLLALSYNPPAYVVHPSLCPVLYCTADTSAFPGSLCSASFIYLGGTVIFSLPLCILAIQISDCIRTPLHYVYWLPIIVQGGREVTVHRPIRYHNLIRITYVRLGYISSESVRMEAATPAHVSKRVVFLPLRGLSLTRPRANARFSQSSSVAVRGGALLNRSRNAAITWDMVLLQSYHFTLYCVLCCAV